LPRAEETEDRLRSSRDHPILPSEVREIRAISARFMAALRTGRLPTGSSFPVRDGPVLLEERSFLLTAAGQLRICTGFPFQPDLAIGHREVK